MGSNFSWTNATFKEYLQKMYGLPPLVYMLLFFIVLIIIMLCIFHRFKDNYYETTAPAPFDTTAPSAENQRLSAIDETPELVINPETTLERKKILGTIRGQLLMDETSTMISAGPSPSHTPSASTPQIEQLLPLVQIRQKLESSSTLTFSPRRKLRLSDSTENVNEGQVTISSQPTPTGQLEVSVSPPETPKRRESLRLKAKEKKKGKDKGE